MQAKQIIITAPTSISAVPYTGIGFQGKLLLIQSINRPNGVSHTGDGATAGNLFGATTGADGGGAVGQSTDNVTTSATQYRRNAQPRVINTMNAGGTVLVGGNFQSWDSDGFTLDFATVAADTRQYIATVLGGSDFEAACGTAQAPASAGSQSITGLSFQPNCVLIYDSTLSSTAISGTGAFWRPAIGWSDTASNARSFSGNSFDAEATMITSACQSVNSICCGTAQTTGGFSRRATLTSYNSDGFTIDWVTLAATGGVSTRFYWVAMQVPFALAGTLTARTTTGDTVVTTTGFTPQVIMVGGIQDTATAVESHRYSLGVACGSGAGDQAVVSHHDRDAAATSDTSSSFTTGKVLRYIEAAHGSPTVDIGASVSAVADGSFTLNYDTVDGTAPNVYYLAIGSVVSSRTPRQGFTDFGGIGVG